MHHLPVQRKGPLGVDERELLELLAEGWTANVIAGLLGVDRCEIAARARALCDRTGVAPRADGQPPVHAARMLLVEDARARAAVAEAA